MRSDFQIFKRLIHKFYERIYNILKINDNYLPSVIVFGIVNTCRRFWRLER
jgi:hypothetical protein